MSWVLKDGELRVLQVEKDILRTAEPTGEGRQTVGQWVQQAVGKEAGEQA